MRKWVVSFLFLFIALGVWGNKAEAVTDTVEKGNYYFGESGVVYSSEGVRLPNQYTEWQKMLEKMAIEEMKKLSSGGFKETTLQTGLGAVWNKTLSDFQSASSPTKFTIRSGTTDFTIHVPSGVSNGYSVNQSEIGYTYDAIQVFKEAVKTGVIAGSVEVGVNVFSMYSDNQVPLSDIVKAINDKKGIGDVAALKYSLMYFANPVIGNLTPAEITDLNNKWDSYVSKIDLTPSGNNMSITLHADYSEFLSLNENGLVASLTGSATNRANGVKSWETTRKNKVTAKSAVDTTLGMAFPHHFTYERVSGAYALVTGKGYKIVEGVKLSIITNEVYQNANGEYKKTGSFADYGIEHDGLVLGNVTVDNDGKISDKGNKLGVIIPVWYKEGVYDTSTNETFYTGRKVKFGNNYSGNIRLDSPNKDLFGIDAKGGGLKEERLRKFAFPLDTTYTSAMDHDDVGTSQNDFTLQVNFLFVDSGSSSTTPTDTSTPDETNSDADETDGVTEDSGSTVNAKPRSANGFVIYRNNFFIEDSDLITWLKTPEAKAMTEVSADLLVERITGKFEINRTTMGYSDWKRLKDIREEMENEKSSLLFSLLRIASIVFGFLIVLYSVLLIFVYWFDIVNVFFDFSLLRVMTFGRYYPVTSKEMIQFTGEQGNDSIKFVTLPKILVIVTAGVFVGGLFLAVTPIIDLTSWLYYLARKGTGGV